MKKSHIVRDVTKALHTAENTIDASLADVSRLMIALTEARGSMKLGAAMGAGAIAKVAEALTALNEAREATVAAHEELTGVQKQLGIRMLFMPLPKPGDGDVPLAHLDGANDELELGDDDLESDDDAQDDRTRLAG